MSLYRLVLLGFNHSSIRFSSVIDLPFLRSYSRSCRVQSPPCNQFRPAINSDLWSRPEWSSSATVNSHFQGYTAPHPLTFPLRNDKGKKIPNPVIFMFSYSHPSFLPLAPIFATSPKRQVRWCHLLHPLLPKQGHQYQHQQRQPPNTHLHTIIQSFGQLSSSPQFSYVSGLVLFVLFTVGGHGGRSISRDEGWAGIIRWEGGGGRIFVGMHSGVVVLVLLGWGKWGKGRIFGLVREGRILKKSPGPELWICSDDCRVYRLQTGQNIYDSSLSRRWLVFRWSASRTIFNAFIGTKLRLFNETYGFW